MTCGKHYCTVSNGNDEMLGTCNVVSECVELNLELCHVLYHISWVPILGAVSEAGD